MQRMPSPWHRCWPPVPSGLERRRPAARTPSKSKLAASALMRRLRAASTGSPNASVLAIVWRSEIAPISAASLRCGASTAWRGAVLDRRPSAAGSSSASVTNCTPRCVFNAANSASARTGLGRYSTQPASRAASCVLPNALAVTAMTGMFFVASSAASRRVAEKPSRSAILTSMKITSGRWSRARAMPSSPPVAVITCRPALSSRLARMRRLTVLSSTTSAVTCCPGARRA